MAEKDVKEVNLQDGGVKKHRRFDDRDWKYLANYVIDEYNKRKNTDKRRERERQWKEIDRQIAMEPELAFKKLPNGNFEDCVLGDGSFPTDKMMKWLLENKFAGYLLIEYEGGDPVNASKKSMERLAAAVKPA